MDDNLKNDTQSIVSTVKQEVPDILTLVSKEKFRRRLLIGSRILAFFLIASLIYWGYIYSQTADKVIANPCWQCGYYQGMQCTQVYAEPNIHYTEEMIKERLLNIANSNINQTKVKSFGWGTEGRLVLNTSLFEFNVDNRSL